MCFLQKRKTCWVYISKPSTSGYQGGISQENFEPSSLGSSLGKLNEGFPKILNLSLSLEEQVEKYHREGQTADEEKVTEV